MGQGSMQDLRKLVVDDPVLRQWLLATPDRQTFVTAVMDVAREQGIDLSAEEVEAALVAEKRQHLERWV